MRVAFLLHELAPSGGVNVVTTHARLLAELEGFECELVVTGSPRAAGGSWRGVPVRVLSDAMGEHYDIAVATWWRNAFALPELRAERRVRFLQSVEERFYAPDEPFDRLGAELALALTPDVVAIGSALRRAVAELHPQARCLLVPNGIDKRVFGPRPRASGLGPLRVLIEGQPGLWLKGVDDALAAVRAMAEPVHVTLVALRPEGAGSLGADRMLGGLGPAEMADLYAETDVLVKLSRLEGLGLAPLEAFHLGVPCVATPFDGQLDYLRHGVNGIEVGFDDIEATAGWLDLLARDRALLARLSDGACATAREWPSAEDAARDMAEALRTLLAEPPTAEAQSTIARLVVRHGELGRQHLRRRDVELEATRGALRWNEEALEQARGRVEAQHEELVEVWAKVDELGAQIGELTGQLEEVRSSRAYRAATLARDLLPRRGAGE